MTISNMPADEYGLVAAALGCDTEWGELGTSDRRSDRKRRRVLWGWWKG